MVDYLLLQRLAIDDGENPEFQRLGIISGDFNKDSDVERLSRGVIHSEDRNILQGDLRMSRSGPDDVH